MARPGPKKSRRGQEPPQGAIRQSQIVTTFGPGAMVDLVHDAVLIGGLDLWNYEGGAKHITEPRLRARVIEALQRGNEDDEQIDLSADQPFRAPPEGDDAAPSRNCGIRAIEFPRWFVCQACRALVRKDQLEYKGHAYRHYCLGKHNGVAVPVRFVSACKRGHLDDFPWVGFAHKEGPLCSTPQLYLHEGASGDFSEVTVHCETCQRPPRRLSEAKNPLAMPECGGWRPWLGVNAKQDCEERQKLIVRTASNSYFPQVMSALTIPDPDDELRGKLATVMDSLRKAKFEHLDMLRELRDDVRLALDGYSNEQVWASLQTMRDDAPQSDSLRAPEFRRFVDEPDEIDGELPPEDAPFWARHAKVDSLPKQLERVVLATKLREVRTQIGFTRLESATANLEGEYDLGVKSARLAQHRDWLPATEIHGEGVMLVLDEDALHEWEIRDEVKARAAELEAGYDQWLRALDQTWRPPFPGVRFYMLHTLSHMLITAISLDCGYAASAIRERIYCSYPEDEHKMAGILLSTGTAGSEGTLGGLVEQGRRITHHLHAAWDFASLCSSDPVCGRHSPDGDYAERYRSGAACHGCLYIAECSCERFNEYLDRALVVPVIGQPRNLAFFSERPGGA
jgi:hypothetical protein